jgi:DNA-binding transcriptional ArsR family regulator
MVEYKGKQIVTEQDRLDVIFHALSDRTRRSLLSKITVSPLRVTELANGYDVSLNSISKHIKVLERANLVTRKIQGRVHYCQMNPAELETAEKWIKQYELFWNDRLDALEKVLFKNKKSSKKGETNDSKD